MHAMTSFLVGNAAVIHHLAWRFQCLLCQSTPFFIGQTQAVGAKLVSRSNRFGRKLGRHKDTRLLNERVSSTQRLTKINDKQSAFTITKTPSHQR